MILSFQTVGYLQRRNGLVDRWIPDVDTDENPHYHGGQERVLPALAAKLH